MPYPIERLNEISSESAQMLWWQSWKAVTVMMRNGLIKCPICHGRGVLVSYIRGSRPRQKDAFACPACGSAGQVRLPFPHDCLIGGWPCCPICGEGQNPTRDEPCDVCQYIISFVPMDELAPESVAAQSGDTAHEWGYDGDHWD